MLLTSGKANLLLTEEEAKDLENFIKEINKELFKKFRNSLFIAFGSMDLELRHLFSSKEFKDDLAKYIEKNLSKQKLSRFKEDIINWNKEIVEKFDNYNKCEICYNFYESKEFVNKDSLTEDKRLYENVLENKKTCVYCWSFVKLGERLKEIQKKLEKGEEISFGNLLLIDQNSKELFEIFKDLVSEELLEDIKELKIKLDYYEKNDKNHNRVKFPFSLHFPLKETNFEDENKDNKIVKTTEDLAKKEEDDKLPLALVTLDVDNLGYVLYSNENDKIEGPKWSKINFKSRLLNYFFTYYVPYLIKKEEKFKDYIYLIFSGGDDTIFFGRADIVLEFLIKIRHDFKKLFGNNLTFSASYVLFHPKENLRNVVDLAEDLLKEAKNKIKEKNALNLNGVPIKWSSILELFDKKRKLKPDWKDINNLEQVKIDLFKYLKSLNDFKFLEITKELFRISEKNDKSYKGLIFRVLEESKLVLDSFEKKTIDFMPIVRIQYYINRNIEELKNLSINLLLNNEEFSLPDELKILLNDLKKEEEKLNEFAYLLYFINYFVRSFFDDSLEQAKEKFKKIINLIKIAENTY